MNVLLNTSKKYLCNGAYFVDMDGNNKAEMILPHGTCKTSVTAYIYKYKSDKAVKVVQFYCG